MVTPDYRPPPPTAAWKPHAAARTASGSFRGAPGGGGVVGHLLHGQANAAAGQPCAQIMRACPCLDPELMPMPITSGFFDP